MATAKEAGVGGGGGLRGMTKIHHECHFIWQQAVDQGFHSLSFNSCCYHQSAVRDNHRPHRKDGEGNVFTGVCLFTVRVPPSSVTSPVLGEVLPRQDSGYYLRQDKGPQAGQMVPFPPLLRKALPLAVRLLLRSRRRTFLLSISFMAFIMFLEQPVIWYVGLLLG